jgi:hypothetical protein
MDEKKKSFKQVILDGLKPKAERYGLNKKPSTRTISAHDSLRDVLKKKKKVIDE